MYVVNTPPHSLCDNNFAAYKTDQIPPRKPSVSLNFFFTQESPFTPMTRRVTRMWWIIIPTVGRRGFSSGTTRLKAVRGAAEDAECSWQPESPRLSTSPVWQLQNNNQRGSLTNHPGLPHITLDWLPLSHPEDSTRNLSHAFWNGSGSKYEMGSQGPE